MPMKRISVLLVQFAVIAVALIGGVAEFVMLQRWRVREWLAR